MSFYERYARICAQRGIDPCGQKTADLFSTTRATISTWGKKGTTPNGAMVAVIADALHVSADYLLGRTDDPTDVGAKAHPHSAATPSMPVPNDPLFDVIQKLDDVDRIRVEAYMDGLLANDKYKKAGLA